MKRSRYTYQLQRLMKMIQRRITEKPGVPLFIADLTDPDRGIDYQKARRYCARLRELGFIEYGSKHKWYNQITIVGSGVTGR